MTLAEMAPTAAKPVPAQSAAARSDAAHADATDSCAQFVAALRQPDTALLRTRPVSDSVVEVTVGDEVVGFLELAGGVWVALRGPVYCWATEVAQNVDPDLAALALFARDTSLAPTGLPRGGGPRLFL